MSQDKRFEECLREQLLTHPSMMAQDVVKLCYQAACGAEHLLEDLRGARAYFEEEYAQIEPTEEPLYEAVSEKICRVNIGAWKRLQLPKERLFSMFAKTVFQTDGKERLLAYLNAAEAVLKTTDFDMNDWGEYTDWYKKQGMPAVRHSAQYREAEKPAYRIVDSTYVKLIP